jgi:2-dehydropantoate 2-reductase
MNKIKYAVIGTGGLGGFYGGMLAKAGQEVHFLFHSDYKQVKTHGLQIDSVLGDFHLAEINAYQSTTDMPVCDVVLVCLKTTSNHLLKEILPPILHRDTCVILVQNGLGIEAALAEDFPDLSIAGGLAFICSSKIGAGHISHVDYGKITIGLHQRASEDLLHHVCADFEAAGVPAEFSDNLGLSRWKKLVWNVPYNGMCVVLNTTTEQLMANPETYSLMKELMLEVIHGANACGYAIGELFAQVMLDSTAVMKPYAPSMKLDYDFRRPLEIEAIYSAPIKAAKACQCDMPKVSMLEKQLHFVQA